LCQLEKVSTPKVNFLFLHSNAKWDKMCPLKHIKNRMGLMEVSSAVAAGIGGVSSFGRVV
jgi:hypothetical protein